MPENGMSDRVDRIEKPNTRFVEAPSGQRTEQFVSLLADIVEQRKYMEFAYGRLDQRMSEGFSRLDQRITDSEQRLTEAISRLERKLDQFIDSQTGSASRATPSRRLRPSKRRR